MDIVDPRIDDYLARTLVVENPVLAEAGEYGRSINFPIIGPQVGRLIYLLSRAIGARRVLELGSGFGYSGLWFALAVGEGGQVVMTETRHDNVERAQGYFTRAGMIDRAVFNVGDALELVRKIDGPFDVVFCDIDKQDYPAVLDVARDKLRVGGFLIVDNMLFYGRVLTDTDAGPAGIRELTRRLLQAQDFVTTIVPVRDGVSTSLRIG